jgi:hypothetical protein
MPRSDRTVGDDGGGLVRGSRSNPEVELQPLAEAAQLADPAFSLPEALVRIARLGVLAGFRVRSLSSGTHEPGEG